MINIEHLTPACANAMIVLITHAYFPGGGMSIDPTYRNLLYKISRAYYVDNLTQKQIGKRYGLSRIKVSRLLQKARNLNVVQIIITPLDGERVELEHEVASRYGIDEVLSVVPENYSKEAIAKALGPTAAEAWVRAMQGDEIVAITWGSTLLAVINNLPIKNWPEVRVVQCLGGLSPPDTDYNAAEQSRKIAQKFAAKPYLLPSPGIVANRSVREALMADPQVSKVLSLAARADIAVVGIGVMTPDSLIVENDIFNPQEVERLKQKGAIGDIGLQVFDRDGQRIQDAVHERIVGLDLEQIRKISRVIGVAGGAEKFEAIRAAVRGNLIDVLVTDDRTAQRLLREN
jgi:DNA-binding transcriptional regulator LsrR (DeoR family)